MFLVILFCAFWMEIKVISLEERVKINLPFALSKSFKMFVDDTLLMEKFSGEELYNLLKESNTGDTVMVIDSEKENVVMRAIDEKEIFTETGESPKWMRIEAMNEEEVNIRIPVMVMSIASKFAGFVDREGWGMIYDWIKGLKGKFVFVDIELKEERVKILFE